MTLNVNEQKVLAVLSDEGEYLAFAVIMDRVGLDRKAVRRSCRSLARKGFAKYGRGLWTEDGEMYGSGYCATGVRPPLTAQQLAEVEAEAKKTADWFAANPPTSAE